jgi:hypothetical protein
VKAIDRWLDQPHAHLDARSVRVVARVRRNEAGGWALELNLQSPSGAEQQTLVADRCATLAQVVALKVALAADPGALLGALPGPAAPPSGPGPVLSLRGTLGVGLGVLPDPSGMASLTGGLELPGWRVELSLSGWLPRASTYPEVAGVGADVALVTAGARGCVVPTMGSAEFPICAGAELGDMWATGFGVDQVRTSAQLWAAAVLGWGLRWPLGEALSFWIGADGSIGIARPAFHMRNLPTLYQPDPAGARTWTGLELRL